MSPLGDIDTKVDGRTFRKGGCHRKEFQWLDRHSE